MLLFQGYQALNQALPQVVLTIGNFDGVHLGHRAIIRLALEKARARGGACVAYTFRPHPQIALRPGAHLQLLSTYDERLEFLAETGLDAVIEEPFSREFSTVTPQEFFQDVIVKRLSTQAIVVGYDFAFGKERQGHLEALRAFCQESGIELQVVPAQRVGEEVASSSRIRQHLLNGELESATRLMGREYFYRGVIRKGDARGRTLGFPTANLRIPEEKLVLSNGVYACRVVVRGPQGKASRFLAVTNIGTRPTFTAEGHPEKAPPVLVEAHLLDTTLDLYGSTLEVRFVKKLRDERKFPSGDALKAQIFADIEQARAVLG